MSLIKPKTALVSLSDKKNLENIINFLVQKKIKILSTGGTYKAIKEITEKVIEVSDFTGFEEMMDGRVKTLHPKIHAGILARRDKDMDVLKEKGYEYEVINAPATNPASPALRALNRQDISFSASIFSSNNLFLIDGTATLYSPCIFLLCSSIVNC